VLKPRAQAVCPIQTNKQVNFLDRLQDYQFHPEIAIERANQNVEFNGSRIILTTNRPMALTNPIPSLKKTLARLTK
jgi:hypothetical protein